MLKKITKKIIVLSLVSILSLGTSACKEKEESIKEKREEETTETTENEKETTEETTQAITEEATEEETEAVVEDEEIIEDATSGDASSSGGLVANGGETTVISENSQFSSTDWKTLEFSLDGHVLTFPISFADIEACGYDIDSEYETFVLEPNYRSTNIAVKNAAGSEIYVTFKNTGDEAKEIKDCDVYTILMEVLVFRDVNPEFTLCNNISFGATDDEILGLMGEPNYYNESSTRIRMDYYVSGESYGNTISFSILDGILSKVEITNVE